MSESPSLLRKYYELAKPGIIYGNVFTTIAAFFFATGWSLAIVHTLPQAAWLFVSTVLGISFVIGSGCVFNNYLDRNIDKKMERTQNRALVTGAISSRSALIYGTILGLAGIAILALHVNLLTAAIALFGWVMYVIVYGLAKRAGWWGALVGSVPGAVPILVGYTAVTNHLDATALILFLILVVWQMPHFYGIAMYRMDEYVAAGIPVLPTVKGVRITKIEIIGYIFLFLCATLVLMSTTRVSYLYLILMLALGLAWLWRAVKGLRIRESAAERKWAKGVFLFSLIVIVVFSVTLAVTPLLP